MIDRQNAQMHQKRSHGTFRRPGRPVGGLDRDAQTALRQDRDINTFGAGLDGRRALGRAHQFGTGPAFAGNQVRMRHHRLAQPGRGGGAGARASYAAHAQVKSVYYNVQTLATLAPSTKAKTELLLLVDYIRTLPLTLTAGGFFDYDRGAVTTVGRGEALLPLGMCQYAS